MLDKSIPYKDLIMKWDGNRQCLLPVCVPPGYRLRTWREGDQKNWARIQKEAGGVWGHDTGADRGMVFTGIWRQERRAFLPVPVCRKHGRRSGRSLHGHGQRWERMGALFPPFTGWRCGIQKKGQGIGTALVREALRIFAGRGEIPVFLHTQPWSYEAVGLYLKAGFFLCRSETFGTHKNQFQEGIRILEQYLEVDPQAVPVGRIPFLRFTGDPYTSAMRASLSRLCR